MKTVHKRLSPAHPAMAPRPRVAAAGADAFLGLCYATVLALGLLILPSPAHQIQEPWFTLMELLIVLIAPARVPGQECEFGLTFRCTALRSDTKTPAPC